MVKDATRGATLEVVVSRMKAVHAYRTAQNPETGLSMRFVAVSATIPNISDVSGCERESVKEHSSYLFRTRKFKRSCGQKSMKIATN